MYAETAGCAAVHNATTSFWPLSVNIRRRSDQCRGNCPSNKGLPIGHDRYTHKKKIFDSSGSADGLGEGAAQVRHAGRNRPAVAKGIAQHQDHSTQCDPFGEPMRGGRIVSQLLSTAKFRTCEHNPLIGSSITQQRHPGRVRGPKMPDSIMNLPSDVFLPSRVTKSRFY